MELIKPSTYRLLTLTFLIVLIFLQASISQEWKQIFQFSPAQTLNKIEFLNEKVGFTAGSLYNGSLENIHITRDGGKTWSNVSSGYTSMRFMDIFIQDSLTIFMSGNEGIIIRSVDAGQTWQTMNTGIKDQLWGIHFVDKNLGFAVGSSGTIIRTENGGTDWTRIVTGIQNLFYDVFFTRQGLGFASGSNVLWKTSDRGANWKPVTQFPFEAPADWIRNIRMVNESIGYACADIGRIYKTSDGGDHWIKQSSGTQEALFSVDFVDEFNGMICGFNGTILKTTDGGNQWKLLNNPIGKEIFYSVDMISKDLGYICTHFGNILKLDLRTNVFSDTRLVMNSRVFPNPCSDFIQLQLLSSSKDDVVAIELYDLQGKSIRQEGIWNDRQTLILDVSSQNSGLYFLKLSFKTGNEVIPITISNN